MNGSVACVYVVRGGFCLLRVDMENVCRHYATGICLVGCTSLAAVGRFLDDWIDECLSWRRYVFYIINRSHFVWRKLSKCALKLDRINSLMLPFNNVYNSCNRLSNTFRIHTVLIHYNISTRIPQLVRNANSQN